MLYLLAPHLEKFWGPFRLLRSHALLLAIGTLLAAFAVVLLLPKLWPLSPRDHGKAILGKDGMKSAGKPTGTGLWVTLILLPIVLLAGALLLFCRKFKLTDAKMAQIAEELHHDEAGLDR